MAVDRSQFIEELARAANLLVLANKCGMEIVQGGSRRPNARCPFHDDHRPSLQFYPKGGSSDRDQFHCFVCGAHGDVFSLVQELKKLDFWGSVEWVAAEVGVAIPQSKRRGKLGLSPPRRFGLQAAARIYSQPDQQEREMLSDFAKDRSFQSKFLVASEVFAARGDKIVRSVAGEREVLEVMREAGIVRHTEPMRESGESLHLPLMPPPRDLYSNDRIIFTIRSRDGDVVGFAGRAIGKELPKYLFTKHFPKGETLYRLDRVLKQIREKQPSRRRTSAGSQIEAAPVFHLFVVEGLLDALRLEVLGLNAVAILGSQLSNGQAGLISELAEESERRQLQLAVHLFLDADTAGQNGMVAAASRLLKEGADGTSFGVDVIVSPQDKYKSKHDPDDLLRDRPSSDDAMTQLQQWCHPSLDFLLAEGLGSSVTRLADEWPRTEVGLRMRALRFVERQLDSGLWPRVLDRLAPFETWLRPQDESQSTDWQDSLNRFLRATPDRSATQSEGKRDSHSTPRLERTDKGRLLHSLQLAQASTQRRELPVDEASWTRLKLAWDVVSLALEEQLRNANDSPEPMIAVLVPRGDDDFRLKALPAPEDLILQQYILCELLREVPSSRFLEMIPAVRYQRGSQTDSLRTTGPETLLPEDGRTVSFAYQIDMDVLEGRTPPRREGMFRPYFDCWMDFISFIDRHVGTARQSEFHVARLDIRKFYDSLPRHAVHDALFPALCAALQLLPREGATDKPSCASLFNPIKIEADERSRAIVDWLCSQSFGYRYLHPKDGAVDSSQPLERGIPQGPDLSAYLANIALFPLDRVVSNEAQRLGGIYARYVDDMVVITPRARDLNHLRAVIEDELVKLGLELSSKTEPLPPMRRDEVREWLTDSRGGLGVSGPFAGPPINEPLTALEPLADAGELDRTSALTLLHDVRMYNPNTPLRHVVQTVKTARRAGNLRFNELVKSARILWFRVLDDDNVNTSSKHENLRPEVVAERFITLWDKTGNTDSRFDSKSTKSSATGSRAVTRLLAWLDGLESLLHQRSRITSELSANEQETVDSRRHELASLVHSGLCNSLLNLIYQEDGGPTAIAQYHHMIDLKVLSLFVAAGKSGTSTQSIADHLPALADPSSGQLRFLYSLAEQHGAVELIRELKHSGATGSFPLRLLLHEAISRLATQSSSQGINVDPLERMRQPVEDQTSNLRDVATVPTLLRVLRLWLPNEPAGAQTDSLPLAAVNALVHVSDAPCDVLRSRPYLAQVLLAEGDEDPLSTELIPSPAGIGIPGILGIQHHQANTPAVISRVDFTQNLNCSPATIDWQLKSSGQHPRYKAVLEDRLLLKPLTGGPIDPNTCSPIQREHLSLWLASAFESLIAFSRRENNEEACPPTAHNLLGPRLDGLRLEESQWEILSHKVAPENLIGQAFRRCGARGLIAEPVKEHHADLWRIGTALADWLGLLDDSRREACFGSVNAVTESDPNHDWALETLMRVALFRLRGISLPARPLPIDEDSTFELPRTITRILHCLKTFPPRRSQEDRWRRTALLLAHLAENRAFIARYDSRHRLTDLSNPGAAVALLVEISRRQFRADEILAEELPFPAVTAGELPIRRPVRAWCLLADRVRSLAKLAGVVESGSSNALQPLIVGSRLTAMTLQLRMQTLEHWSGTTESQRKAFADVPLDLTPWNLDATALLHINQNERNSQSSMDATDLVRSLPTGPPEALSGRGSRGSDGINRPNPAIDAGSNVQFLFSQLADATATGSSNTWEALAGITPLGWCVTLGGLLGFLRTPTQKTHVPPPAEFTANDAQVFRDLAQGLAVEIQENDDVPWGDLQSVLSHWTQETTQSVFAFLLRIDSACGLSVTQHESRHFRISDGRMSHREVHVSDGDLDIPAWQIVSASAQREPANRGAERFQSVNDKRWWYRWTETRRGNRLLSIGTVQPGLASLAGLGRELLESRTDTSHLQDSAEPARGAGESPIKDAPGVTLDQDPPALDSSPQTGPILINEQGTATAPSETEEVFQRFLREQCNSWRQRQKLSSHLRIGLFQWDVDDSYRHPLFEACMHDDKSQLYNDIAAARKKGQHGYLTTERAHSQYLLQEPGVKSCAEHRRQALLKAALKACRELKVDVLLLPEYSVRLETIEWLRSALPQLAPDTWVWAGTCRKPPYLRSSASSDIDWSALLPVVHKLSNGNGSSQWNVTFRKKKYPAIAMGEQFAPAMGSINPVIGNSFDLRSKVMELICSEVFIVTSPANHRATAHAYRDLLRKFGIPIEKDLDRTIDEDISTDLRQMGKLTSMCDHPFERRSILLVPAMTSRVVDYTVLGQASYLAAGLTTVFCNAASGNGHGQSCFIGHDGWDKDEKGLVGVPGCGPYHGALPGIFCPFRIDRGWLGTKEQALVIADIDPFYATEGNPRPQMLHPPLQLVAHLPIVESWEYSEGEGHSCRCQRAMPRAAAEVAKFVSDLLASIQGRSLTSTVADTDPRRLNANLVTLSTIAGHKSDDWLEKRRKAYLSEHAANPQLWPPPVALDWLWVDLADPKTHKFPAIEIPAYSQAPGE
jgi:DNA primase catalytic core